jgi:outer membrane protein assembly factor BamB
MRRALLTVLAALLTVGGAASGVAADPPGDRIPLPDGFLPEGISIRADGTFYVASIATGAVFAGDVRTGDGSVLVESVEGRSAVGLEVNRGRIFVAGGETGQAYVYDADTGEDIAVFQLSDEGGLINDVVVTRRAAWFTDSILPVLYRVPLRAGGAPYADGRFDVVPYSGDIRYREGFNVNGIEAAEDGDRLVVVQSNTGLLFSVNPDTGRTRVIDLGDERVRNGDGLLLDGDCLYVVRGFNNLIALVELEDGLREGDVVKRIRDEDFDVPTTLDDYRGRLYVVNARFDTPVTPETEYWVAVVRKAHC